MKLRLFSVNIKIDFLFAATLAILLCFNTGNEVKLAVLFAIVHECGHLLAIIICGEKPESISFGLFGMKIIRTGDLTQNYKKEIITALAGPMTNFLTALLFLIINCFISKEICINAFAINTILGLFNIMPVFSLDGGRALECFLKIQYDGVKSEKILKVVSFIVLVVMMAFGFYILIESGYNFTFLLITVYLMITLFVKC